MLKDYGHGFRDGPSNDTGPPAAEEAKLAWLLGQSRSWRTTATREVRLKTLQVARQRIRTVLNRSRQKHTGSIDPELASALDELDYEWF